MKKKGGKTCHPHTWLWLVVAALVGLGVGFLIALNQDAADDPSLLFIQQASSATVTKTAEGTQLVLNGVSPETISFSERPNRLVAPGSTEAFVGHWNEGADNFAMNPPNAALSAGGEVFVVELLNPVHDADRQTLTYDIVGVATNEALLAFAGGEEGVLNEDDLPVTLSGATLFIDGVTSKERFSVKNETGEDVRIYVTWGPDADIKIGVKWASINLSGIITAANHKVGAGETKDYHTGTACYDLTAVSEKTGEVIAIDTTECVNLANTPVKLKITDDGFEAR